MSELIEESSSFIVNKEKLQEWSMRAMMMSVLVCLAEALSKHQSSERGEACGVWIGGRVLGEKLGVENSPQLMPHTWPVLLALR